MYCPKCGKENPENARFCMHCGEDLQRVKIENVEEILREHLKDKNDFINEIDDFLKKISFSLREKWECLEEKRYDTYKA